MNNHMNTLLFMTLYKEDLGIKDPDEVRDCLRHILKVPYITKENVDNIMNHAFQPKTQEWVHALLDKGFSPTFIQKHLGITKQGVSYHANRPLKRPYYNPAIHNIVQRYKESVIFTDC